MNKQEYAGFWVRVAAFVLDYIPIAAYLMLLVALGLGTFRHCSLGRVWLPTGSGWGRDLVQCVDRMVWRTLWNAGAVN